MVLAAHPRVGVLVISLATLLIQETKAAIYEYALGVANAIGLPVSTWQAGDPTRSQFHVESEMFATLEEIVVGYIRSGFLDYAAEAAATGNAKSILWLKVLI